MRVFEGMYRCAPGVSFSPAERLYEYEQRGRSVSISCLCTHLMQGPRIGGRVFRMEVSAPLEGVLRIRATHHVARRGSGYLPEGLPGVALSVKDTDSALTLSSGELSLVMSKREWGYRFERRSVPLCESGAEGLGSVECADGSHHMTDKLSLEPGECIYGLGERVSPFVRNGQSVRMWNEDAATVSDLSYKNIPLYLSSRGYGVLVNSTAAVGLEVATEDVSAVRFTVPGRELDYLMISGDAPAQVLERYTSLTGRPARIPSWSYGLWLTTSFTTSYDERTVIEHVEGMLRRGIPLSVFHFDCYWMRERHWCDFQWDSRTFPDPVGLVRRLHSLGVRVCLWINPYVSELSSLHAEGVARGYFLRRPGGEPYQIDWWQPGCSFVDFTNPEARSWYQEKLRALLDQGVDTFKTDFGESAPADALYADGSDGAVMHNRYSLEFNRAVFELLEQKRGAGQAVVFARSATAGSQRYPVHWGGDCAATYASMAAELRGGLSFALSGGAFWSHDIGGFFGEPTPDLYKRWVAFGLLSSHARLHGESSYRVPWHFGEESVEVLRRFARLRASLLPYLASYGEIAHRRGLPVMRPMVLEFPDDPACRTLDRQYMLGSELLVAPVLRPDDIAEYYLPEGRWTDFWSGEPVPGGRWMRTAHDYFHLPLLVRQDSILPLGPEEGSAEGSRFDSLTLRIYSLRGSASCLLADGERSVQLSAAAVDDGYELELEEPIPGLRVTFVGLTGEHEVAGEGALERGASATVLVSGRRFRLSGVP